MTGFLHGRRQNAATAAATYSLNDTQALKRAFCKCHWWTLAGAGGFQGDFQVRCFAAAFPGIRLQTCCGRTIPHTWLHRGPFQYWEPNTTQMMHKIKLEGFFLYMSCVLDRYLSCEAHLGSAWSYSESRQGAQTKTNYAWALGGSQWERQKTSLTYS